MRQHYLRGLPFLVSKIYYFEVRCSFVAIKILLCRSREMKQGCRLARLFGKSIMDFYARNQYFLMNTQPISYPIFRDFLCYLNLFNIKFVALNEICFFTLTMRTNFAVLHGGIGLLAVLTIGYGVDTLDS